MARNYHDEESLEMSKSIKDKRRPNRKRKLTKRLDNLPQPTSSDEASDNDDDQSGPFAFVRTPGCRYLKPRYIVSQQTHSISVLNFCLFGGLFTLLIPFLSWLFISCISRTHVICGFMIRIANHGLCI
uniref:SJCHGC08500 protein n=1 Tax=Schistosoma japonicum TaxID=6182 RepID=Q5DC35_SCHJA|nr:SJCHGC08500 protein [Schistosoma japonicum]